MISIPNTPDAKLVNRVVQECMAGAGISLSVRCMIRGIGVLIDAYQEQFSAVRAVAWLRSLSEVATMKMERIR